MSFVAIEGIEREDVKNSDYVPGPFFRRKDDSRGPTTLYVISAEEGVNAKRSVRRVRIPPDGVKLRVDILDCRQCHGNVSGVQIVESVLQEAENRKAELARFDQGGWETMADESMSSGVFVDGNLTFFKGPISETDVVNALEVIESARRRCTNR
jgi:hypothetical protein